MQAVRLHELGGPDKLRIDEIAIPDDPGGRGARARRAPPRSIAAISSSRRASIPNCSCRSTLGSDGAGEIASAGAVFGDLAVGDEVVIDPMLAWGDDPRVWDAAGSSILGMPRDGTLAQYVAVPAENVYRKPTALSMEEAAAIPLAGLTAYRAVFTRGALRPGETVLITGIGGGVADVRAALCQARWRARDRHLEQRRQVTHGRSTRRRPHHQLRRARRAGRGRCGRTRRSTSSSTRRAARRCATRLTSFGPGGRIVVYGGTNGDATIKMFPLFWKHVSILGTSMGSPQDFEAMLRLFDGGLRPVVDRGVPAGGGRHRVPAARGIDSVRESRSARRLSAGGFLAFAVARTVGRRLVTVDRSGCATGIPSRGHRTTGTC